MSSTPTVIATVSGDSGYDTAYVSFKSIIDIHGALTGIPTVVSRSPLITISEVAIDFAGTVNEIPYAAGQMLTFKATSSRKSTSVDIEVDITWATDPVGATHCVAINKVPCET